MSVVDFKPTFYNPFEVRHRRRTSRDQLDLLQSTFGENPKPSAQVRQSLAEKLQMSPRSIQVWFQNRRAKQKQKLTAKECVSQDSSPLPSQDEPGQSKSGENTIRRKSCPEFTQYSWKLNSPQEIVSSTKDASAALCTAPEARWIDDEPRSELIMSRDTTEVPLPDGLNLRSDQFAFDEGSPNNASLDLNYLERVNDLRILPCGEYSARLSQVWAREEDGYLIADSMGGRWNWRSQSVPALQARFPVSGNGYGFVANIDRSDPSGYQLDGPSGYEFVDTTDDYNIAIPI